MRRRGTPGKGRPHAAEATEAAAHEATEAATAATAPIAGTPTHFYEPTREAGMSFISLNVRNRGQAGNVMLATSFSQFDPEQTFRDVSLPGSTNGNPIHYPM